MRWLQKLLLLLSPLPAASDEMRQLKIAKTPTPAQEAEAAAALRWLEQQPVTEGIPSAEVAARLCYIMAVARQYQGLGLGLLELVMVGWQAGLVAQDSWDWRVRQGMVGAAGRNNTDDG